MLIAKSLINAGANVNLQDLNGVTALMHACMTIYDMVELLIRAGANIALRTSSGMTALMYAAGENYAATVKLIIDNIPVDSVDEFMKLRNNYGETALIIASQRRHFKIVEMILGAMSVGAIKELLDIKSNEGYTVLMYGAQHGQDGIVKTCLKFKADTTIYNNAGKTAFDLAILHKKDTIIELLHETQGAPALIIECMKKQDRLHECVKTVGLLTLSMGTIILGVYIIMPFERRRYYF